MPSFNVYAKIGLSAQPYSTNLGVIPDRAPMYCKPKYHQGVQAEWVPIPAIKIPGKCGGGAQSTVGSTLDSHTAALGSILGIS